MGRREEAVSRAMGSAGREAGEELGLAVVPEVEKTSLPRGVDLEIVETKKSSDGRVIVPNLVRINGTEVLIPDDASITIGEVRTDDAVRVTLTMFVASLVIKGE